VWNINIEEEVNLEEVFLKEKEEIWYLGLLSFIPLNFNCNLIVTGIEQMSTN
jgi:hypothetical protein